MKKIFEKATLEIIYSIDDEIICSSGTYGRGWDGDNEEDAGNMGLL